MGGLLLLFTGEEVLPNRGLPAFDRRDCDGSRRQRGPCSHNATLFRLEVCV
jgi:hypothetical protein